MRIVLGLDTIKELLKRLGNPEKTLNIVHVAGTNGKGSTIAMLSTVLVKAGYKVGKYTSPAVFCELEMYQIDNENISREAYARISSQVGAVAEAMKTEGWSMPTKFELDTAIAFALFAEAACDIVIIETGMGGDLDATNVCERVLASVITTVSIDHTAFLGDSLGEIASHKAGIIKKGCPVVVSEQTDEVIDIVKDKAIELGASCIVAKESVDDDIQLSLRGSYQRKNAATVIAVVEVLKQQGYNIPNEAVYGGLEETSWPGRFEIISNNPLMIIDGAHNPGAVAELKRTLEEQYAGYKYVFILGVLADKDYSTEIEMIAGLAENIITVTPDNERALGAEKLAEAIKKVNSNVQIADTVVMAVGQAIDIYDKLDGDRLILAFGSLSYMAAVKKEMEKYADRM